MSRKQFFNADFAKNIRLIATDMDGTLTHKGQFTPRLLDALWALNRAKIPVLIVTGRSAGWVNGLVSYLPISGAIAENGGVFCPLEGDNQLLSDISNIDQHRAKLAQMFESLRAEFPQLKESSDNQFRLTDWTFDIRDLTASELKTLDQRCTAQGWSFTYSTVQCHIKPSRQEKAEALCQILKQKFPKCKREEVLTLGDSPNDATLFDAERFPVSVGVANIEHYADRMTHYPMWITEQPEIDGFCEVADAVLRGSQSNT
jgi:HAD superfamily hydrolase (TIGR01484 family)